MGQTVEQQGDLARARKDFDEALSIQEQLGEKGSAADTRRALAEWDYNSGDPASAESLARTVIAQYRQLKAEDGALRAAAVLIHSLVAQGKLADARQVVAEAAPASGGDLDVVTTLSWALARARVLAAGTDRAAAEALARQALADARSAGLVRYQLEASLALAGDASARAAVGADAR